ncbi:MAG: class IV adenylate cyclase [Deltaproteobacteria bacterium]|nr:MAG: class IV adenylate cyclase [Deltaproteobacteria bacterium]
MPSFEIEVKFYIKNINKLLKKLSSYTNQYPKKFFEKNILFDTNDFFLQKSNKILRLRSYSGKNIITLKKSPKQKSENFKIMEETEIFVDSFDKTKKILHESGFIKTQIYEKERIIFKKENLSICVDYLPFGNFLELEGAKNDIIETASQLDFDWNQRILPSYIKIFKIIKNAHNLTFNDITFKNFKNTELETIEKTILKNFNIT